MMNFMTFGFPLMAFSIMLLNLGIMIYGIYLFHMLATSNRKIAEAMEILVNKIDTLGKGDSR